MLVDHVPPPVVLSRERLAALLGVGALVLRAVKLARLVVLVVDVTVQMRLGAKPHGAAWVDTLMWAVVVALVVTSDG